PFAAGEPPTNWKAHPPGETRVAYHPNGTQAFTAGKDGAVTLWDVAGGKPVRSFGLLPGPAAALAVSRDGALVAAASGKVAKVWAVGDGKEVAAIGHPAEVASLAFSSDRARLLTGATDNLARVWELPGGRLVQSFGHGAAVLGVAYHPTAPAVVTASADRTALISPVALTRMAVAAPAPVRALALTPD